MDKLAVVVGGGPAPGINGVIQGVVLEGHARGIHVIGLCDGFKWLARGQTDRVRELLPDDVSRIHLQGGSILGTSREAPAKSEEKLAHTLRALSTLGVSKLVTIGGDDTASTATAIAKRTAGAVRIAHVPKTIDNDLPLPDYLPTFGYQTARQVGADVLHNLTEDARTTGRWYFVVAMGRTAGHLALGMGKVAGAAITLIPEAYGSSKVRISSLVRELEGSILKSAALGRNYGIAVIAEGVAENIDPRDLGVLENVERDDHGHVRLAELPLGTILKNAVRAALAAKGVKLTIVDKNIGYELRCATPVANDIEYTRDLGAAAVQLLAEGQSGLLVCIDRGELKPLALDALLDPKTNKMSVRRVNIAAEPYRVACRYMTRLAEGDLDSASGDALAGLTTLSREQLREYFFKA